jgi:hypothetical protein
MKRKIKIPTWGINWRHLVQIGIFTIFITWQLYIEIKRENLELMNNKEVNPIENGNRLITRNKLDLTLHRLTAEYHTTAETIKMLQVQLKQIEAATEEIRYKLDNLGFAEEEAEPVTIDRNKN